MSAREDSAAILHCELVTIVREEIGIRDENLARSLADALARAIFKRMGGTELYVPRANRAERDELIRREFDGTNRDEICKRYEISKTQLYRIVSRKVPFSPKNGTDSSASLSTTPPGDAR